MNDTYREIVDFIKSIYQTPFIALHEPTFGGNEKKYVCDAIDSTFVSSVGEYVNRFEQMTAEMTGAAFAVATVNGTAALHMALKLIGVQWEDDVISPALTFVGTANAIAYCGARPVFLDVEKATLGLNPDAVKLFLEESCQPGKDGSPVHQATGRRIAGCIAMHTFGHPCRITDIIDICSAHHVPVVEDAAESLGSLYKGRHTGAFGTVGIFSYNGNKTVTCGGGGAIVTHDPDLARRAKHLTTTAKVPHPYHYVHDAVGYNYRMPNLNAALACAQLEQLDRFIANKRRLAERYAAFFDGLGIPFITEPEHARSNYWLNAILLPDADARDQFLNLSNQSGVMTRPTWQLMNRLPMYQHCHTDGLRVSQWLADRLVNIPSSVVN